MELPNWRRLTAERNGPNAWFSKWERLERPRTGISVDEARRIAHKALHKRRRSTDSGKEEEKDTKSQVR